MKTKVKRLGIAALMAATMLIFPFAAYADELPASEEITEEVNEIVEDNTEGDAAKSDDPAPEDPNEAALETPADPKENDDMPEIEETQVQPETPPQVVEAVPATEDETKAASSPFAQVADKVRKGGYADLTDLRIPADSEEELFNYLAEMGFLSEDIDSIVFAMEDGYIVCCDTSGEFITEEDDEDIKSEFQPDSYSEHAQEHGIMSTAKEAKEPIAAETESGAVEKFQETIPPVPTPDMPKEEGAEPAGSLMAILLLLAGCLKSIIQYLI